MGARGFDPLSIVPSTWTSLTVEFISEREARTAW